MDGQTDKHTKSKDLTENYCVDLYIFTNNVCYPVKIKVNKVKPLSGLV